VSSLIFLAFSVISFIVIYGIMFTLMPMILGAFYTAADNVPIADPEWAQIYEDTEDVTQYLVPLTPTIGIFILILKVAMVASVRGRD
jgi:hypothetical protein